MALDFRYLGPFEVADGPNALVLGGRRQRSVLALLAIHVGEVLSTERIVDEIWADLPPSSAPRTVHSYVSRLRKALQREGQNEHASEIIARRYSGYVLDIPRESIDANRFEQALTRAKDSFGAGRLAIAAEDLAGALMTWRGTPLADLAYEPFAARESQRLLERHLEAIELRIDAELGLGRHSAVIADLEDLVTRYPVQERFWAQLITALYRCGRQADALAAYQRVRQVLVESAGIEPGLELSRLELQVLQRSADLDPSQLLDANTSAGIRSQKSSASLLPSRLPHPPTTGLVGRNPEQRRLEQIFLSVVEAEAFRIALISGEPGIGKTSLLGWFARQTHSDGAVILYGRCDEDRTIPYGSFVEALDQFVARVEDDVISAIGDEHLPTLARLLPAVRERRPDVMEKGASDPDAERWLLYGAVVAVLRQASSVAPVVLLIEDLHWADRPTLELLRHISSHCSGRVLLLITYRETEISSAHGFAELQAALIAEHTVIRLPLSGLADAEVVTFMEAMAGHKMDNVGVDLAHTLHRETDGNPFFMAQLLRHLAETGAIIQEKTGRWIPGRDLSGRGVSESVRQVIGARVRRLGDEAFRTLSAASVLGDEFEMDILAAAVRADEDSVLTVLENTGSAALTSEVAGVPGRFRFVHSLIHHALYHELSATRRARLHKRIAETLEGRAEGDIALNAAELAHHWLSAGRLASPVKAVAYARLAGDDALRALAPAEAIRWFEEALAVLSAFPDEHEQARCMAGLGEARRQAGDGTFGEILLEATRIALVVGDKDTLVQAALANNRGWTSRVGEIDSKRIEALEMALRALPETDDPLRARLLVLLAQERTYDGDYRSRRELADAALEMARRVNDPATVLDVLLKRRLAIRMAHTVDELLAESIEARKLAYQLEDPVAQFWSALACTLFSVQVGSGLDVVRYRDEFTRLASEIGQPLLEYQALFNRSWCALLAGDITQAEALTNFAFKIGNETEQPDAPLMYFGQLFAIRLHQGRLDEIADEMVRTAKENPGISAARAVAAQALVESGRNDEARVMLESEKGSGFPAPFDYFLASYLDIWSQVASRLEDSSAAQILFDRLNPWPKLVVFSGLTVQGAVAHDLAVLASVLGHYESAEVHFAEARQTHKSLSSPYLIARTDCEWGLMLLRRGASSDRKRAESLCCGALDVATRYGYKMIEKTTRAQLSRLT
ncbi:MAG TPA: BTAD domain-containing putative transcriptional regulator [Chloroflexota bacterium]|nr:BTAD domain-containing putative transcriptional regulator [Chloroflexota bacterium]